MHSRRVALGGSLSLQPAEMGHAGATDLATPDEELRRKQEPSAGDKKHTSSNMT